MSDYFPRVMTERQNIYRQETIDTTVPSPQGEGLYYRNEKL